MPRRSTPRAKTDDLAFPIRVKFAVPGSGIASIHDTLGERMPSAWDLITSHKARRSSPRVP